MGHRAWGRAGRGGVGFQCAGDSGAGGRQPGSRRRRRAPPLFRGRSGAGVRRLHHGTQVGLAPGVPAPWPRCSAASSPSLPSLLSGGRRRASARGGCSPSSPPRCSPPYCRHAPQQVRRGCRFCARPGGCGGGASFLDIKGSACLAQRAGYPTPGPPGPPGFWAPGDPFSQGTQGVSSGRGSLVRAEKSFGCTVTPHCQKEQGPRERWASALMTWCAGLGLSRSDAHKVHRKHGHRQGHLGTLVSPNITEQSRSRAWFTPVTNGPHP